MKKNHFFGLKRREIFKDYYIRHEYATFSLIISIIFLNLHVKGHYKCNSRILLDIRALLSNG